MVDICSALSSTTRLEHDEKHTKVYITTSTRQVDTVQRSVSFTKQRMPRSWRSESWLTWTEGRSFDRWRRCYIFVRYTDASTRAEPIRHPSTAHEPQTCEALMQTMSQTGEGVRKFCSSSSLHTSESASSRNSSERIARLALQERLSYTFTGYVSIFCLAKASSAWLDQHHLSAMIGRYSSP